MKKNKPLWVAILSIFILPVALIVIKFFPNALAFLIALSLLFAYFAFISFVYNLDKTEVALNFMTAWSFVVLMVLVENKLFHYIFIVSAVLIYFFIAYWSRPQISHDLHVKEKPLRRMMMMLYVFNVYAFLIGAYAINIYFPNFSFVILSCMAALYSAFGAYMIWSLYFKTELKKLVVWSIIFATVIFELMWVINLLPFGYLASGLLTIWIWYILQLFVRFHLNREDIVWKKQISFLLVNFILYILVLFLIRWI
ncbi:MAG: hypothetical protein WC070_05125 [Candidatus Magasanikbacteria bacterium]